jgi:hypothetical protein
MGIQSEQSYVQAKWKLERSKYQINRIQVNTIRKSFYRCIQFLKEYDLLCTGWGGKLQFIEGETAVAMFEWATETQTPILNVHDAFACKEKDEMKVATAMYAMRERVLDSCAERLVKNT